MQNEFLDVLVRSGSIKSYAYVNVSEDDIEEIASEMRNTERLVLYFANDLILKIDTCCSGCSEDTSMIFEIMSK
jgi:hypothetical protein